MPKGTKKKFIDKKNSVTFRLVHRSQKDPLIADEKAPQHVLIPIDNQQNENEKTKLSREEIEKRKEQQKKFGIFYDDDYDYLQHLRGVNKLTTDWEPVENANCNKEKAKINLPSSVFESNVEEKVGLLNRDMPIGLNLDVDPDVVAAMDDDFDFEDPDNELEDNFIELANGGEEESEDEDYEDEEYDEEFSMSSDEDRDQVCNLEGFQLDRTRTTKKSTSGSLFSMSSSIIRRNENLKLLDDIHEKVMSEFDDNEIGSLDCDEIEGYMDPNSELLKQYAQEFSEQRKGDNVSISELMKERLKITELNYNSDDDCDENDDLVEMTVEVRERDRWDCESILTINSTTRNHPGLIKKSKIDKILIDAKTGIPKNVIGNSSTKLTAKNLEQFDNENSKLDQVEPDCGVSMAESRRSQLTMLSYRPDDETPEEKRERKQKLKEYRRERRVEKKANTLAFKQEQKRQEKIQMNNRVNVQGNRIL